MGCLQQALNKHKETEKGYTPAEGGDVFLHRESDVLTDIGVAVTLLRMFRGTAAGFCYLTRPPDQEQQQRSAQTTRLGHFRSFTDAEEKKQTLKV